MTFSAASAISVAVAFVALPVVIVVDGFVIPSRSGFATSTTTSRTRTQMRTIKTPFLNNFSLLIGGAGGGSASSHCDSLATRRTGLQQQQQYYYNHYLSWRKQRQQQHRHLKSNTAFAFDSTTTHSSASFAAAAPSSASSSSADSSSSPSSSASSSYSASNVITTTPTPTNNNNEISFDLTQYQTIRDLNSELDKLAKRCSDDTPGTNEDVIGCAALAESMVRQLDLHVARELQRLERRKRHGTSHRHHHHHDEEEKEEEKEIVKQEEETEEKEGVLQLEEEEEKKLRAMKPDIISYNIVVKAWARACGALADNRGRGTVQSSMVDADTMMNINVYTARDAAVHATNILKELETNYLEGKSDVIPDVTTYNAAIDAWAKSRLPEADTAEEIMLRMEQLSTEGFKGKHVVNGDVKQWEHIAPDSVTYNSVIEACSHTRSKEGLARATSILEKQEAAFEKSGNARIKPTIRTINAVINLYAKLYKDKDPSSLRWDAAVKAEELLRSTQKRYEQTGDEDYKPDVLTYTSVIDAYARVGNVKAVSVAESLMNQMEREYEKTGDRRIRPNYRTYTALITGWSKTRDERSPHRAEEILKKMEDMHRESLAKEEKLRPDEITKPNYRTYTAVINCWARSKDPTKAQRSLRILKKMNDLYKGGDESAKPTLYTYNSVIDACARCQGSSEQQAQALKIAFAVLKAIEAAKGIRATNLTYSGLLKATASLLPAGRERNDVGRAVFEKCRKEGMVEPGVIKHLRLALDGDVLTELLEVAQDKTGYIDYKNLPQEWSKNVP